MTTNFFAERTELNPALVGRESQRALLRDRMKGALEGRGSVVAVAGEAGTGKTRLMVEMECEAGRRYGMLFLRGAGDPARAGIAYGLFVGVLAAYLAHASEGERDALRETIEELVPHLGAALFPRDWRGLESSPELDPELRHTLLQARITRLLLELAQRDPVLLCLEDLHWADSASLQMLGYLATRNVDASLVIVGTYRPEECQEAGRIALGDTLRELSHNAHFQELRLERLSPAEARVLVSSCFTASGFGYELMEMLYRKSEGIPFSLLQYLELLRDEGVISEHNGLWIDRQVRGQEVPDSVRAIVRKRFEDLADEEREVLRCAAVQGEAFASELVAEVLGWPHARVWRILEHLERTTHLVRREEDRFRFTHLLLLNPLYNHLPVEQRRDAHLRLASYLEQRRPTEAELLAYHFYCASAFTRALPYLLEAAKRARDSSAFWETNTFLNQALEALEEAEVAEKRSRRLEILLALAEVAEMLGELSRYEQLCREVLGTASHEEDGAAVGRALLGLGWLHSGKGEWKQALELYDRALSIFTDLGETRWCITTYMRLGNIAFERSRLEEAASYFNKAKEAALKSENMAQVAGVDANLGVVASVRGDYTEALVHYTRALHAYQEAGHRYGISQTYHNLGMTYAAQRAWEEALACYAQGEKLARDMGTVDVLANILVGQASVYIGLSDLDGAAASCQGARIYYEQMQDRLGVAECKKVEGMINRGRGLYSEAEALLVEARHSFQDVENELGVAECDLELGLVRQHGGDVEGARRYLQKSSALFEQVGAVEEAGRAKALLADLVS